MGMDSENDEPQQPKSGNTSKALGIGASLLFGNFLLKRLANVKPVKRKILPLNKTVPMFQVRLPAANYKPPKTRDTDGRVLQMIVSIILAIILIPIIVGLIGAML